MGVEKKHRDFDLTKTLNTNPTLSEKNARVRLVES